MKKLFMLMAAMAVVATTVVASGNDESSYRHSMPKLSRFKRMCTIHRIWYDIRFGGCPQCRAPKFGF